MYQLQPAFITVHCTAVRN